jgi:hypothetical protein
MSQILLPPPSPQPGQEPGVTGAGPAWPAPPSAVQEPPRPHYEPEPPKRPSAFWRAVKWPLRKVFKLLYRMGSAAKRHKWVALATLVVLLALGGVTYGVYQYTHPAVTPGATTGGSSGQASASSGANTPFTIVQQEAPPLPPSIINWLHGQKVFDAKEMWNSLSPQAQVSLQQQGVTEQSLQSQISQEKAAGVTFEQYIYTGGFAPGGVAANYTVQMIVDQNGQRALRTWYFVVNPTDGKILVPVDLNGLLSGGQG